MTRPSCPECGEYIGYEFDHMDGCAKGYMNGGELDRYLDEQAKHAGAERL
jgi:hypothetical protein